MRTVAAVTGSSGRAALVAALLAMLIYANAPANDFAYDDVPVVVEDSALAEPGALPERLLQPYWPGDVRAELGLWRPLTTALFGAQRLAFGLEPALFHLTNVLLHALATALVVLLAAELVTVPAALVAGLLFAVHPVHVEAVANVVGLSELLSGVLYLGACLLFLRATSGPATADEGEEGALPVAPGPVALAALALLYALAFLAKESAVTLPAALVLLDLVRRPVPLARAGTYLRRRLGLLAVLGVVAGAVLAARMLILGSVAEPDAPLGGRLLAEIPRIWTLGVVWLHYARLLLAPMTLSADYSPDVVPVLTVWTAAGIAGAVAALLALGGSLVAWRAGRKEAGWKGGPVAPARLPAFAVVWLLVTLSPVSNVFFLSGVLLAERTLYLPSVGVAVAAGWALTSLVRARALAGAVVLGAILVLFGARSWTRTPTWETTETVMLTLATEHPRSGRAQWMVGDVLAAGGDTAGARRRWARAVGHLDSSPWLLAEVGEAAMEGGDERLAEFLLRRAWEERPGRTRVARRLALLYSRRGSHGEAVAFARHVVRDDPDDAPFWHVLSGSLSALGRYDEALSARRRVIELGEDPWQQWLLLARLQLTRGDSAAAGEALDRALAKAPDDGVRETIRAGYRPLAPEGATGEGG